MVVRMEVLGEESKDSDWVSMTSITVEGEEGSEDMCGR